MTAPRKPFGILAAPFKSSRFYTERGACYSRLIESKKAVADCATPIEKNPGSFTAYPERGKIYLELEKYEPAIADFISSLKLSPDNRDALKDAPRHIEKSAKPRSPKPQ